MSVQPIRGKSRRRSLSSSSQLQLQLLYSPSSAGNDEATATRWWGNVFSKPKIAAAVRPPTNKNNSDQENVDEYLEFLDRRYRRLHEDEVEEKSPLPFSALSWLLQGSSEKKRLEEMASEQQREDALYVLGVAGLASQKLLQKHQLVSSEWETSSETVSASSAQESSKAMEVEAVMEATFGSTMTQKVLRPTVRMVRSIEDRKSAFLRVQGQKLRSALSVILKYVARGLTQGPMATGKALLELGGGKKSIALTVAGVTAVYLILRPAIQAIATEAAMTR